MTISNFHNIAFLNDTIATIRYPYLFPKMNRERNLRSLPRGQQANVDSRRGSFLHGTFSQFAARRSKGMNFITTRRRLVKDKAVREERDREPEKAEKDPESAGCKEADRSYSEPCPVPGQTVLESKPGEEKELLCSRSSALENSVRLFIISTMPPGMDKAHAEGVAAPGGGQCKFPTKRSVMEPHRGVSRCGSAPLRR